MFDALHGISLLRIAAATAALQIDAKSPLLPFVVMPANAGSAKALLPHLCDKSWAAADAKQTVITTASVPHQPRQ